MYALRPSASPHNRLDNFNSERAQIVEEVATRVVADHLKQALQSEDASLEYTLNDVAFCELQRLEAQSPNHKGAISRWQGLAHKLGQMSEPQKQRELDEIVRYHVEDIAGNFNPRVYRFAKDILPPALSLLLNPISGMRDGIQALSSMADKLRVTGPLEHIRSLCDHGTVVVAPTHSSNLDSIVVGFGLSRSNLPPVLYGAGKNLFTNPLTAYFMHNLGAYRVDRRLQFQLYKEVLKEYSTVLLERGYHSLFFPGGSRSRSNRVEEKLKLGLLGTAVTAIGNVARATGQVRRIFIVPLTINYRLVLEAETLIDDYLAATGKSRYIIDDDEFSRLGRIATFAKKTLAHQGSVILHFGAPLDPFGNKVDHAGVSLDPCGRSIPLTSYLCDRFGELRVDRQRDQVYTRHLGEQLAMSYRQNTVFLGTHIVARAAFDIARRRTGRTNIYELLRVNDAALAISVPELIFGVNAIRDAVQSDPDSGFLDSELVHRNAEMIINETIRFFGSYHTKRALYRSGAHIRIGSMKLLYYYQQRTCHLRVHGEHPR